MILIHECVHLCENYTTRQGWCFPIGQLDVGAWSIFRIRWIDHTFQSHQEVSCFLSLSLFLQHPLLDILVSSFGSIRWFYISCMASYFQSPSKSLGMVLISDDILYNIFLLVQATHTTVRGLHPHIILSHVSKRWRLLALSCSALWSDILITRKTRIDFLGVILERSGNHGLDVNILHLPVSPRIIAPSMHNAISFVGTHAQRWKHLQIRGNAAVLTNIMPILLRLSFPRLQSFQVVQTAPRSVLHFGPFKFSPSSLVAVRLQAVTIHVADLAHLAGVQTLDLDATSCQCMLDQSCMERMNNAAFCRERPSMAQLRRLSIKSIIFHFPNHPSFCASSIVSLKLGGMRGMSPASIPEFIKLFSEFSGPNLEDLELNGIVGFTWEAFILSLNISSDVPRYLNVKTLTFRSLRLGNLNINFARQFPNITRLMLFNVDPEPLQFLIHHHPLIWSSLLILIDPNESNH